MKERMRKAQKRKKKRDFSRTNRELIDSRERDFSTTEKESDEREKEIFFYFSTIQRKKSRHVRSQTEAGFDSMC